ncbi:uncharacterized protein LOC124982981 [Sciurus carolinensis]|uniref:uncharacterized protein LOC124982981 n=1 Tax=Sciurus carolinensis TaxID=30640 RepID=UPI001FB49A67|nr:uncharacterized protein LOC124982981 [Sciurus carolinensis]
MLLPLLGACAVVGPFQGPEWEPVRGLISQDCSCRDPRCCGNLLVLCLFLIWQVRHYWHQFTRTRLGERNVIKVPLQKWVMPSMRCETFFRLAPEFFSPGDFRGLDAYVQQWVQKQRWGCRRNLLESWTQYLFSSRHLFQDPSWGIHTSPEPIFCTSSFSSTCPLSQDSSWEAWHVPWCLRGSQTHSALDTCQRIERQLVHSQENLIHMEENQEELRCKIDAETQTPGWGYQDKSGSKDALEIQTFERKNKKEPGEEEEGQIQAHGLGKQGQTGDENAEETRSPQHGRGDTGAENEAEEERNKDQVGNKGAVQTPTSGRENLEDVKQENRAETQALGWGKEECSRSENITETQALVGEKQGQGGGENARATQASRGEKQELLIHVMQARQGNQGLARGEESVQPRVSRRKKFREIRQEDWVVIQTPWWGNQSAVVNTIDREFKISCWKNQNQTGGEPRAKIQTPEENDQKKDRDEDGTDTLVLEAENQGLLRSEMDEEIHPAGRKNEEQFGDENRADIQVPGKRNTQGFKGENGTMTQELGGGNQGQLGNEFLGNICIPQCKNREHIRSKDGANTQIYEAGNWGELTSKIDGETHLAGWKKVEHVGGESSIEILLQGMRNLREAEGEGGTETWAGGERSQSQLGSDVHCKIQLSEWKNQKQMEGKDGTEIQAPKKRKQREPEDEDDVKTQRPERENQGQLENVTGSSHYPGMGSSGQTGGENIAEKKASEKKNQREAGIESGRKIHRLRKKNQRLLRSKVHRKTCSLECKVHRGTCSPEWKNEEDIGGGNAAEIQIQGKKNSRRTTGGDNTKMQTPVEDDQGQSRKEIDEVVQKQGQGNQKKGGDAAAAEIWTVGSQRKYRAEEAGGSQTPWRGDKNQIRGKDAMGDSPQGDCSSGERPTGRKCSLAWPWPTTLIDSRYEPPGQEQAAAVNSVAEAPCPEMKPCPHLGEVSLLAAGEGEHLTNQGIAPARDHNAQVSPASQQAQTGPRRKPQKHKRVDPEKTHSLMQQLQNPQSLVAPFGKPSACPSLLGGQVLQAATATAGVPTILTSPPKWPVLKKSKRLLLESLMRRRIAHLKWGLPRRILESYLLFNFFGSCSLPLAGVRLPELGKSQELQRQQEKRCEAQGSMPSFKSPERFQRISPQDGKNSKLPTQARALERCRPHRSESMGISIPPEKPRRVRSPGGTREPQIQEEAPQAKLPAPRNPRPSAESMNCCSPERDGEPSTENNRGRKMIRPEVSQKAERAPKGVKTSSTRASHGHWKKEHTPWEASQSPRHKCQQPTYQKRESLEPVEVRGAGQQPSSGPTDSSRFKGSLHSKTAKLSMTLLSKKSWSPQLAKPTNSAPSRSLRDPMLLPRVSYLHSGEEDSTKVHTASERDHQPPGHCSAGVPLHRTKSPQDQSPQRAPQNSSTPKKFGFMKHLRCFLFQCGLKK